MRVVISDTSCLVDIKKADLLLDLFSLPYTFVMPHELFDDELVEFSTDEKKRMLDLGLKVRELDSAGISQSTDYFNAHHALTLNDCFAMRMAEEIETSILLTGDKKLREVAERMKVEVRGVLWVMDEFSRHAAASKERLVAAIKIFLNDPAVFLPPEELRRRIKVFEEA